MKTKIIISDELRDFLKKKRALRRFIRNTRTLNKWEIGAIKVDISTAFKWAHSPEGYNYWNDLFNEFRKAKNTYNPTRATLNTPKTVTQVDKN